MLDKYYNKIALGTFVIAKLLGVAGIMCMFINHYLLAVLFMAMDGVLLVTTFIICMKAFGKQVASLASKCPSMATKGFADCNGCKDYSKCWNEND